MHEIFRKLLAGLSSVCLLNAVILTFAAQGRVDSGVAIAGDKASENLWHPVLTSARRTHSSEHRVVSLPEVLVGSEKLGPIHRH